MKQGWLVLLVAAMVVAPRHSGAQVSVYGEASGSAFNDQATNRTLYGGTAGLLFGQLKVLHHLELGADIEGRIVSGSSESLKGLALGPRFGVSLPHGFTPYGKVLVGFGRYTSTSTNPAESAPNGTTDAILEFGGGLVKQLTPHLDGVAEFSETQLYALGGLYNPKTVSVGAIWHFVKR